MSFFLFTPHLSPLCSPPCAALVDPSDPPGALGQLSEHMAHSPDGLDLDHSSSLCHPSGCLHSQAPGWLVPRPTLSLSWLPVNSQPSPRLAGTLASWALCYLQTSFQSHFTLPIAPLGFSHHLPSQIPHRHSPSAEQASAACWGLQKSGGPAAFPGPFLWRCTC